MWFDAHGNDSRVQSRGASNEAAKNGLVPRTVRRASP